MNTVLLVVDDQVEILSSIERMIRNDPELEHIRVVTATSGMEAVQRAQAMPVHVVMSDFYMPGMDGVETLEAILELHPRAVPVLISSGVDKGVLQRAANVLALFGGYLEKPLTPEKIKGVLSKIRPVLRHYTEQREDLKSAAVTAAGVVHTLQPIIARTRFAVDTMQRFQGPRGETLAPFYDELYGRLGELEGILASLARFAGKPPRRRDETTILRVVELALDFLKDRYPEASVDLETGSDARIKGEPQELAHAIFRILENGVEASPAPPRVTVDSQNGEAVVVVRDMGPGFPPSPQALIPPFITLKEGHTGLGLSEAYGIIRSHGGALLLRNWEEGAEVVVRLPQMTQ